MSDKNNVYTPLIPEFPGKARSQMPKAYSYVRWSSDGQTDGDSERRQLAMAQSYADKAGLGLDLSHIDRGVSSYKGDHRKAALGRFLDKLRSGEIAPDSWLLIESIDRLSREPVADALDLFMGITRAGITIVTLFDNQVYSRAAVNADFTKLLYPIIKMSVAHEESHKKSVRRRERWKSDREQAHSQLKPMSRTCPGWLKLVDGKFEPIPERVEVVKRIFWDLTHSGKSVVAASLNREGIPSWGPLRKDDGGNRTAKPSWHASMIQKLVEGRAVLGEMQPFEISEESGRRVPVGDPIPGYYGAPVIDEATYHLARAAIAGRKRDGHAGRKGLTLSNLFGPLATCEQCSGRMIYKNKGGGPKGGTYLTCSNASRANGCANTTHYRYYQLEAQVLSFVTDVDLHGVEIANDTAKIQGAILEARHQLDLLANKERRAAEMIVEGGSFLEIWRETNQALVAKKAEIDRLEGEFAVAVSKPSPSGRQEALRRLRDKMAGACGVELHRLRAAFSAGLREIADMMLFAPDGSVILIILAGLRSYRFDNNGVRVVDLSGVLSPEIVEANHTFGKPERRKLLSRITA